MLGWSSTYKVDTAAPTKVVITVNSAITDTHVGLTVAYKPGTGAVIEDVAGNDAIAITATAVARVLNYATAGAFNTAVTASKIADIDNVTVTDSAANITATIATLTTNAAKLDVLDVSDVTAVTMTVAQAEALASKMAADDTVKVVDTSANINAKLDSLLENAKVSAIDSSDNGVALTVSVDKATDTNLVKLALADTIHVTGTADALKVFLDDDTIAKTNVDILDVDAAANAVSLTVAQAGKLTAGLKFAADDAITIVDSGENLTAADVTTFIATNIGGTSVTLDASDNKLTLTKAEFEKILDKTLIASNGVGVSGSDAVTVTGLGTTQLDFAHLLSGSGVDTVASASADAVIASGDWHFADGTFTYWDIAKGAGGKASVNLEGVSGVDVTASGGVTPSITFTAVASGDAVVFAGGSSDITFAVSGSSGSEVITFTRSGVTASSPIALSALTATPAITPPDGCKFTANDASFVAVAGKLAAGSTDVTMTHATTHVAALVTNVAKIADGGISGAITLSDAQYTALADKITDTDNSATVTVNMAGTAPTVALSGKIDTLVSSSTDMALTAVSVHVKMTHFAG